MRNPDHSPQCFAICYHPEAYETTLMMAAEISLFLEKQGASCVLKSSIYAEELEKKISSRSLDVLIALGGDGTMLRAGHLCAPWHTPILGINTGKFGFLTEVKDRQWENAILRLLSGDYRLEDRFMLRVEHRHADELLGFWDALNEVVISRGSQVRPIRLSACVDGYELADYVADALVVSTPTGSTAYALAAGGPVIAPEMENILIIPVAPHLSVDRGIIISKQSKIKVSARTTHEAVLSVDGQAPVILSKEDHILAYASKNMVSFIRFHDTGNFYRNLTMYMERNPSAGDT